jgi:hypothetical protein
MPFSLLPRDAFLLSSRHASPSLLSNCHLAQDAEVTECAHERTALLGRWVASLRGDEAYSIVSSAVSKDEQALGSTAIGERLPYNDYSTIDWLHDLVSAETCGMRQHD